MRRSNALFVVIGLLLSGCAQSASAPVAEELLETVDGTRLREGSQLRVRGWSRDGRVVLFEAGDWARITHPPPRGEPSAFPGDLNPYVLERPSRRAQAVCPGLLRGRAAVPCELSEDGRYVYTCSSPILRIDWRTCEERRVERAPGPSTGVLPAPDGRSVYFVEGEWPTLSLVRASFEDGSATRHPIPSTILRARWDGRFRVSRNGEYVALWKRASCA